MEDVQLQHYNGTYPKQSPAYVARPSWRSFWDIPGHEGSIGCRLHVWEMKAALVSLIRCDVIGLEGCSHWTGTKHFFKLELMLFTCVFGHVVLYKGTGGDGLFHVGSYLGRVVPFLNCLISILKTPPSPLFLKIFTWKEINCNSSCQRK